MQVAAGAQVLHPTVVHAVQRPLATTYPSMQVVQVLAVAQAKQFGVHKVPVQTLPLRKYPSIQDVQTFSAEQVLQRVFAPQVAQVVPVRK